MRVDQPLPEPAASGLRGRRDPAQSTAMLNKHMAATPAAAVSAARGALGEASRASEAQSPAALMAAALFLGLFGLAFFFVTITLGLVALGVPAWLSSLIVTVVLLAASGVLVLMGKKKLEAVNFVPTESIEHIRGDLDSLKADVARVRSR